MNPHQRWLRSARTVFWRAVDRFVPEAIRASDPETRRQAEALVAVGLLVTFTPPVGLFVGVLHHNLPLGIISALTQWLLFIVPLSLWRFGSLRLSAHLACALGVIVPLAWMLASGGAEGAAGSLFVLGPMVAVVILGARPGLIWAGVAIVVLAALGALNAAGVVLPSLMSPEERMTGRLGMTILTMVLVLGAMVAARRTNGRAIAALGEANLELEAANRELRSAREIAEVASVAKGRFLANMSHELRTPMNGVIGFTDLLLRGEADAERRAALEMIKRSGHTMVALIDDVLDFSKLEAGRLAIEETEFDLAAVCADALEMVAHRAHGNRVEVGYRVTEDWDHRVRGDPARLTQILVNLLGNATKFTTAGSVRLVVSRTGDDRFRLEVRDTGIGISEEAIERLFVPFTQADASTTRRFGGTGLGLSIARQLAHAMGGEVGLHSREGVGSTFFVEVPLPVVGPVPAPSQALAGRRVQVHAKPVLQEDLHAMLARLGAVLTDEAPDLLVLDDACDADRDHEGPTLRVARVGWPGPSAWGSNRAACRVPLRLADLAEAAARALGAAESTPDLHEAEPTPQDKLRVLLVEDNPVNQLVAERMLGVLGHGCQLASNGREALDRLQTGAFDLVLMDCHMPQMDGLEATRIWRGQEQGAVVPIIALTANTSSVERAACEEAGMDGFIQKPVTLESLAHSLEAFQARRTGAAAS